MYSFKYNGLYLAQGWSTFCLELTCITKSEVDAYRQGNNNRNYIDLLHELIYNAYYRGFSSDWCSVQRKSLSYYHRVQSLQFAARIDRRTKQNSPKTRRVRINMNMDDII
jgi:hypothetical protein